jgi:hypothetical protein
MNRGHGKPRDANVAMPFMPMLELDNMHTREKHKNKEQKPGNAQVNTYWVNRKTIHNTL